MLVHNGRIGNGEALASTLTNLLSSKEWIEDTAANLLRYSTNGITDLDLSPLPQPSGCDMNYSLGSIFTPRDISDGMSRIYHQIQYHLIKLSRQTGYVWHVRVEICLQIGIIFPLIARDRNRTLDRSIDIYMGLLLNTGM